jgi:hypothetical protein
VGLVKDIVDKYPLVMTDRFLDGRRAVPRREMVRGSDFDYNFVVPLHLVKAMESVIETENKHDEKAERLRRRIEQLGRGSGDGNAAVSSIQPDQTSELVLSYGKALKEFTRCVQIHIWWLWRSCN